MKKHTKQSLQKEVIGYDNLTTFRKDKLNIYKQICRKGLKNELLGHLTKISWKKISDDDLITRGKQFTSVAQMIEKDNSVYVMLRTRGLLDYVVPNRIAIIDFTEFLTRADTVNHKYLNYTGYQKTVDVINLKCGHSYIQNPKNHIAGAGCPNCCRGGFKPARISEVYLYEIDEVYLGFGITGAPKQRHRDHRRNLSGRDFKLLGRYSFSGEVVKKIERELYKLPFLGIDVEGFRRECVSLDLLNEVKTILSHHF